MKLVFWTSSDATLINRTIGTTLKRMQPNAPAHRFVNLPKDAEEPLAPASDEIVIVCGKRALNILQATGLAPKSRTVTSMREKPFRHKGTGGWYMVTFDPAVTLSEPHEKQILDWDVRLAARLAKTGSLNPEIGNYQWVNSFQPVIDYVNREYARTGQAVDVSCDTETETFHPWYEDRDIVSIAFTGESHTAHVLYTGRQPPPIPLDPNVNLFEQIEWLLNSPKIKMRGANFKYDLIWIAVKWGIECTNFKFDTLIAGSLVDENRSNSLNVHAKVYSTIGGYDDCVAPETRLLTHDLKWVSAGEVETGDELLGFDEFSPLFKGRRRKLREAKVESTKRLIKDGLKITFSNGVILRCSVDHGFLCPTGKTGGSTFWKRAYELLPGSRVKMAVPFEFPGRTYEDGWLGGFLDGEGYCAKSHAKVSGAFCVGWSQKIGPTHNRAVQLTKSLVGEDVGYCREKSDTGVLTTKFTQWPSLKIMMRTRPERLISKKAWVGATLPQEPEIVTVVSKEYAGRIEVVSIQTSSHTFIAEGVCSHNSFNASQDKSKMGAIPPDDNYLTYAGGDTDACQQSADVIRTELLEDPELARFYVTIAHPAVRAFEKIERRGILVDAQGIAKYGDELRVRSARMEKEMLSILPNRLRIKHLDKINSQLAAGKSPFTSKILKDFFFAPEGLNLKPQMVTTETKEPQTTMAHLRMFLHNDTAKVMIEKLEDYRGIDKTIGTFIDGFLKHLRPDGRFHPSYMLFHGGYNDDASDESGTVTGRLAARDPAIQTLPAKSVYASSLRKFYIAPPGKVVFAVDYIQGELKVVACVANENRMIESYEKGLDLHAVTGARLGSFQLDEFLAMKSSTDKEKKELFSLLRAKAKPANFGLLYGMQVQGFINYTWAQFRLRLTWAEAEQIRNAFFELYPGLPDYHEAMRTFVKIHEHVRSPLGRVRHLPTIRAWDQQVRGKAELQAINAPVQATLTDMLCWSIAEIEDAKIDIEIVAMIHDSFIGYVDADKVHMIAPQISEIMSNLPFQKLDWKPQLRFDVEAKAGLNLAELFEIKLAA